MLSIIQSVIRESCVAMAPYPSARRLSPETNSSSEVNSSYIYLNANEWPWSHSIDLKSHGFNRYPSQQPSELIRWASQYYQVSSDQILLSRGSDEGIDLLTRLCCQPHRDQILICPPTFLMYEISARLQEIKICRVPLKQINHSIELDRQKLAMTLETQVGIKLIFLCSPNNPSGQSVPISHIADLCEQTYGRSLVVVDEAYAEFSDQPSAVSLLSRYDNLVVLRTLSKAFGLAGLRLGFTLGHPDLITVLQTIMAPYPIPSVVVTAALAQLNVMGMSLGNEHRSVDHPWRCAIQTLINERQRLYAALTMFTQQLERPKSESFPSELLKLELPIREVWPSSANFLLLQSDILKNNIPTLGEYLKSRGIIIRDVSHLMEKPGFYRVTVGTPKENTIFLEAIQSFMALPEFNGFVYDGVFT